jgi:hypothetical protein
VGNKAAEITLTPRQRAVLEPLARARTAPQRVVERCRIILIAAEGRSTSYDRARSSLSSTSTTCSRSRFDGPTAAGRFARERPI